jgi:hypothetical protein
MNVEQGSAEIFSGLQKALDEKTGFLVGRNGTIELETLFSSNYTHIQKRLELHAGIWPQNHLSIDTWSKRTVEAIQACDLIVAGWYLPLANKERVFLYSLGIKAPRIPLRSLEPYYVSPEKRWTSLLKDQKVAIINSFALTAIDQIKKREEIWPLYTDSLLPSTTEWIPILTGYCPSLANGRADWPEGIQTWEDAVRLVVSATIESGARIAIVGCGGLGLIIGHELKKKGLIVIVMGGATQVLFGIKGGRWATHDVISHFWNDAWVYPTEAETPRSASTIENGCYWSPAIKN